MKIFLASPLGFMESSRPFISRLVNVLEEGGHTVLDPWDLAEPFSEKQESANHISDEKTRREQLHRISMAIAGQNHQLLKEADGILAILDGSDVDSGTASEIGCAFGIGGKIINGYRNDFRRAGENDGCLVNLQIQYWIEQSGGQIYTSLEALRDCRWA
ncbi:MAG TPA: nucleoside 2-deoxyribosyltransferase [bacterium]|nr:nucleoside 2-deoxyribosyltransferase [bacterium]HQL63527.1 nucleoside 2-deoxyribosyltransferase [bacterium]